MPLIQADVELLRREPSPANRTDIVRKIAGQFVDGGLSDRERLIAGQIFRVLCTDVAVAVRRAMSEILAKSALVPHDVALTLARDLSEVAVPILQYSPVLDDDDLIEIIRRPSGAKLFADNEPDILFVAHDHGPDNGELKQTAIARRNSVSARISGALVENGGKTVVVTLLGNRGAEIPPAIAHRIIDRFGNAEPVQSAMIERDQVPADALARMACLVSETLRRRMVERHDIAPRTAAILAQLAREKALINLFDDDHGPGAAERLARRLHVENALTPTLVLRALCIGKPALFEAALAVRAGLSVGEARDLMRRDATGGFRLLFEASGLPAASYRWIRSALEAATSLASRTDSPGYEGRVRAMVQALLDSEPAELDALRWHDLSARDLDFVLARIAETIDVAPRRGGYA